MRPPGLTVDSNWILNSWSSRFSGCGPGFCSDPCLSSPHKKLSDNWRSHAICTPFSNFVASFIRAGDELLFPLGHEATVAGTQIYIRKTHPEERRWDVFQAEIGYATQPRKDKRNNLVVSAEVPDSRLGISAINLPCEALRDYFYVGNRRRGWHRQSSFYELLRVNPKVSPAELRLAFKLRTLELGTARAPAGDLRALNRAFNILARPELRA